MQPSLRINWVSHACIPHTPPFPSLMLPSLRIHCACYTVSYREGWLHPPTSPCKCYIMHVQYMHLLYIYGDVYIFFVWRSYMYSIDASSSRKGLSMYLLPPPLLAARYTHHWPPPPPPPAPSLQATPHVYLCSISHREGCFVWAAGSAPAALWSGRKPQRRRGAGESSRTISAP